MLHRASPCMQCCMIQSFYGCLLCLTLVVLVLGFRDMSGASLQGSLLSDGTFNGLDSLQTMWVPMCLFSTFSLIFLASAAAFGWNLLLVQHLLSYQLCTWQKPFKEQPGKIEGWKLQRPHRTPWAVSMPVVYSIYWVQQLRSLSCEPSCTFHWNWRHDHLSNAVVRYWALDFAGTYLNLQSPTWLQAHSKGLILFFICTSTSCINLSFRFCFNIWRVPATIVCSSSWQICLFSGTCSRMW